MVKEFLILLVELFIISYSMGYIINKFIIKPICGVISESTKDKTLLMIDIVDGYGKAKELIDNIISDSIQEYVVLNPNILMENEYITTENENKIIVLTMDWRKILWQILKHLMVENLS